MIRFWFRVAWPPQNLPINLWTIWAVARTSYRLQALAKKTTAQGR